MIKSQIKKNEIFLNEKKNIIILIFIFNLMFKQKIILNFILKKLLKIILNLNAERKNKKSIKQNINISRSEFLPSISLSKDQKVLNQLKI